MATPIAEDAGERIFVLAPHGRDSALTVNVLGRAGYDAEAVADGRQLAERLAQSAGAAIVAAESLDGDALEALAVVVAAQPPWSDIPFLIFTPAESAGAMHAAAIERLASLGNVVLLERPIRVVTLRSAVETAIRARRRQYAMRDLLARVEEGIVQRDQFLAMLGHELRNPLGAVLTAAQVLDIASQRDGVIPDAAFISRQTAVIRRQGSVLTRLVDDLLDVARVTSGKVPLDRKRLDAAEVVRRAVDGVAARADHAGVEVRYSPPADPLWISGDATRLEQVTSNLLTNAVKYTPAGGRADVTVRADGSDVVISIRDNGMGIEPDLLPRIFDLFKQAERTLARSEGGLGIGLTLVRTLVELHGGTVTAHSDGLGRGSEFVVRLPLAPEAAASPVPVSRWPDAAAGTKCKVFVVEDHEDNRNALVTLLEQIGCTVRSAADGEEGARAIVAARPDVAIVDIGLPGMDGYAVARYVRGELKRRVVLVALTGYGQPRDRELAAAAGFDVHLRKPVDVGQLRALVTGSATGSPR